MLNPADLGSVFRAWNTVGVPAITARAAFGRGTALGSRDVRHCLFGTSMPAGPPGSISGSEIVVPIRPRGARRGDTVGDMALRHSLLNIRKQ
jgi:hypothetical protein